MHVAARTMIQHYHERTKHRLDRYAAGPDTLDWDMQPDPFRRFIGSRKEQLPLTADTLLTTWANCHTSRIAPAPFNRSSLGALLELSFGIAAWKQYGPDRWAVRCNPSSGNLHPTEAYVLAHGVIGLDDGLWHYAPKEHALEQRATLSPDRPEDRSHLWIALSSIAWREAWKYGERAFRYCQLDAGHALGAVRYAAAALGWCVHLVPMTQADVAALLGTDRSADFAGAENEEAEFVIEITRQTPSSPAPFAWTTHGRWSGQANRLDQGRRLYHWPIIDEVTLASRCMQPLNMPNAPMPLAIPAVRPPDPHSDQQRASTLIRQRRSAQRFDRHAVMSTDQFLAIVRAMQVGRLPWDAWPGTPRLHPVFFTHRVAGLPSGIWVLPRSDHGEALLRTTLSPDFHWQPHGGELPLYHLANHPALASTLRTVCCHQAIAADACVAIAMLADFSAPVQANPAAYRSLFHEAGLMGQALYLEAEAHGLRGTGIGCFFDDTLHDLLGIRDQRMQSLYHFTIGMPVLDERITTEAPYAAQDAQE
jgi:SagB-type dehydrogenase family enzyme